MSGRIRSDKSIDGAHGGASSKVPSCQTTAYRYQLVQRFKSLGEAPDLRKPIKVYENSSKNETFAKNDIRATDESLPADAHGCQHGTPAASALPSFYPSGAGGGDQSGIPLLDVDHRRADRSQCQHGSVHEKPLWQCRMPPDNAGTVLERGRSASCGPRTRWLDFARRGYVCLSGAVFRPVRFPAVLMATEKMSSNDFWWTLADKCPGGAVLKPCFGGR
jgi:hypothetical protein